MAEPTPELSYLKLVERNSALLQRLLDALAGYEIPEVLRVPSPQWWQYNLPSFLVADFLVLEVEANAGGLLVRLRTASGQFVRHAMWSYDGEPWPNAENADSVSDVFNGFAWSVRVAEADRVRVDLFDSNGNGRMYWLAADDAVELATAISLAAKAAIELGDAREAGNG